MTGPEHAPATDPGGQPPRPPHTRISRGTGWLLAAVAGGLVVGSVGSLVPVDRVVYSPGPVYDILGDIDGTEILDLPEDLETYPTDGHLYFTTIRLSGGPGDDLSVWEWLRASSDPSRTVVPRSQVFPENVTAEQVKEQNTALMQHSQEDAAVVALRETGHEIREETVVAQIIQDAPADGVLHVEDVILGIDGDEVTDAPSIQDRLQSVDPGDTVSMRIRRDGAEETVEVPTREDPDTGRTIIGVYLAPRYDMPYDITFDAGDVGGPSAGLMFSLGLYDELTEGSLTGGRSIAGTGTIDGAGTVGPIGGITQKMYASEAAGADLFLAPVGNCGEVSGAVPDGLTVAAVGTFEEALDVLETVQGQDDLSGLDLPSCEDAARN